MSSLQGKTILVTGASSGIGRALCELLATRGANILGVTRRPSALSEDVSPIVADLTKRSGQKWLVADTMSQYADIRLIADAIERAGGTDRERVMAALRSTNTDTGPAKFYLGGRLRFDEKGRRADAPVVILQWRNGKPVPVSPAADAIMEPMWPKA